MDVDAELFGCLNGRMLGVALGLGLLAGAYEWRSAVGSVGPQCSKTFLMFLL